MLFASRGSLLAFFLLTSSILSACQQGIDYYWGGNYKKTYSTAYADSKDYSGTHTAEFRGSFVSRFTGSHKFRLDSDTYSVSSFWTPQTKFTFDGTDRGTHQETWYWTANLVIDFRYRMNLIAQDNYYWIRIGIGVEFTGRPMANLNGDLISTCEQSGCRDTALSRSPYNCQPSPTRSRSPSPTRSHTPSPTHSHTPSPTHSHTPSPTRSVSPVASASLTFLPSPDFSGSAALFRSPRFEGSFRFGFSSAVSKSSILSASSRFFASARFTASSRFGDGPAAGTAGNGQIGLIVGIGSSLVVVIVIGVLVGCFVVRKFSGRCRGRNNVVVVEDAPQRNDHSSTVRWLDDVLEDRLQDDFCSMAHLSDGGTSESPDTISSHV